MINMVKIDLRLEIGFFEKVKFSNFVRLLSLLFSDYDDYHYATQFGFPDASFDDKNIVPFFASHFLSQASFQC